MPEQLLLFVEIVGTIAFAVSGALVGLQKKMDIFGVSILGVVTAVGGGVIRDLILGITPPITFQSPLYAVIAIAVSVTVFLPFVRKSFDRFHLLHDLLLLAMDSLGLGIFTVVGIRTAFDSGFQGFFLLTFVGVVTGVGGGILRDVLAGQTPYIFVKHIYACASLVGAVLCALLWNVIGETFSMILGAAVVVTLRFLAAHYHWNLPKAS